MFKKTKKQPSKQNSKIEKSEHLIIKSENDIKEIFHNSEDVFFQSSLYRDESPIKITLIGCDGLIDTELLNNLVFEGLSLFFEKHPRGALKIDDIKDSLHLPHLADVNTKEELFADIYSGKLLIYFEGYNYLVSTNIANRPQRTPEETTTEVTIKGPRDYS